MKLAILGTDADILQLAAAARSEGHNIVWLGDIRPEDAAALSELVPQLSDQSAEWELLLDHANADAVLCGRGTATTELRLEQLKRLAAEAVPVLIVHPAFDSVLPYYELDMVRRETGCLVQHFNPLAGHPIANELSQWVRDGHLEVGPIHQLTFDRYAADTSRTAVLMHLARDVVLMAAVAGDIRRVNAIGPATADSNFASLQIQMSCSAAPSVRWTVGAAAAVGSPGFVLTLVGETGTVALRAVDDVRNGVGGVAWQLQTNSQSQRGGRPLEPFDSSRTAIQMLDQAVNETDAPRRAAMSTWDAATRAMEVVDAVELSLQKGRTIEVFQQELTERLAFRGTMAAIGCGLLLVAFIAIVLVTLLGGAEAAVGRRLIPSWPVLLLAVLAFFLLLQAVPLMVRKRSADRHR